MSMTIHQGKTPENAIWHTEQGGFEAFPKAKINIGLYVVERRPDGYHNLQTVFYPIPLHDNLQIRVLKNDTHPYQLQTAGNVIEGNPADNLVVRVYESLKQEFNLPPLDIYLYKRIPTGAGLGGGSSDAAYMMRMLNEAFTLNLTSEEMERRIAKMGADCAFFIQERPSYATGIGDILSPIQLSLKGMYLLLVKPPTFVSTQEAYKGVVPRQPQHELLQALSAPVETWRETVGNDFELSVFRHHPNIAAIKQTLYDMGAVYASMSGSGSSVYGLFKHPIETLNVFSDCFVHQQVLQI